MTNQKCRDVNIKVKNVYGKKIFVNKMNYRDKEDKKWRDDDLKKHKGIQRQNRNTTSGFVKEKELPCRMLW